MEGGPRRGRPQPCSPGGACSGPQTPGPQNHSQELSSADVCGVSICLIRYIDNPGLNNGTSGLLLLFLACPQRGKLERKK